MKKIIMMFLFALLIMCAYKKEVKALSGNGNYSNPYIVTTGAELKEALSKGASYWKYIAVTDTIAIKEMITVDYGLFRIFSKGGNHTIRRSQSMSADVNSSTNPRRCMKIDEGAEVEVGFTASDNILTINGSKDSFTDSRQCNEWFYVGKDSTLVICRNCVFKNAKNTIKADEAAPIRNYGTTWVYGEIVDCQGNNGGAIKTIGGSINISYGGKIHNCKSGTEGGAIYCKNNAEFFIDNGSIYNNEAAEEGGGVFTTGSTALVLGGSFYNNKAGKTGGGIFSGNNSTLYFGTSGAGPTVSNNYAKNSGGGVRCNGGTDISGGYSEFRGGTISGNKTDVSGGGISVGKPSTNCASKIIMSDTKIINNTAANYGGGLCFSEGVKGIKTNEVGFTNTTITGNNSGNSGGGILLNTELKLNGCIIKNNKGTSGGGVFVATSGTLRMASGKVENNTAKTGTGISVYGIFELSNDGFVNENNTVYLAKNKHIDITGKLTVSSYLASNIEPEEKTKGTILVDVTYSGGSAESELYYEGSSESEQKGKIVKKKFATTGKHILRSAKNNTQVNSSRYIIISDKYSVKYNGNSLDPVANVPDEEIAFWKENYTVSDNIVSRIGFVLNNDKHWNLSADGTGKVFKPGAVTQIDSNTTVYAIWEEVIVTSLSMVTVDRYYVVGQKISLTAEELTKKVKVENNLNLDVTYEVKVTKIISASGKTIAQGADLKTENYINTDEGAHYRLMLFSSNLDGSVTCTGEMSVSIIDDYYDTTEVRFISAEFVDTLNPKSKWKRKLRSELMESLNNENNYIFTITLEKEDLDVIRDSVKGNEYIINRGINLRVSPKLIKQ